MEVKLNGKLFNDVELKPLSQDYQTSMGCRLAAETTKNNGIDEIYFEHENKKYVIATDKANLSGIQKKGNDWATLSIGNEDLSVKILHTDNEVGTPAEATKNIAIRAAKQGFFNGIGGVAAVAIPIALKVAGKDARITPLALAAGFIGGFAWGACTSIASEVDNVKPTKWTTIKSVIDENKTANEILKKANMETSANMPSKNANNTNVILRTYTTKNYG